MRNSLLPRPLQAGHPSLLQRRLELDAEGHCGDGRSRRYYSPLPQRRIESDADRCCGRDRWHSGGFLLRIMPPSWHPVPACFPRPCCRRAIHRCSNDGAAAIREFGPEIQNHCTLEGVNRQNLASIRKSGLEIKNRCTQEDVNREKLASIPKSGPEIKNQCTLEGISGQIPAAIPKSKPEIKNHCTQERVNGEILR